MTTLYYFADILLLAEKGKGAGNIFGNIPFWVPLVAIGLLWYFLLIRPQRSDRNKMKDMLANLQKHARVVTIGGIFGTVANVQKESESVTICLDDANNTRIKILRSAIARVIVPEDDEKSSKGDSLK